eukprot:jgi/Psemu1/45562/gm1.45562_g
MDTLMEANAKFTDNLGKLKSQPPALAKDEDLEFFKACSTQTAGDNLLDRISRLESSTAKPFSHESNTKKVHLVNTYFTSQMDVGAWCILHANNSAGYLHVVDPHRTGNDASFESSTRRSRCDSPETALVMKSFCYAVLEVFTGSKISADPMILSAIPSWTLFEGEESMDGFRYKLQTRLDDVVETIRQEATINISMEGLGLAQTCIQDTKTFTSGLIQWMCRTYQDLQKSNPFSSKENWRYISHCMQAIFDHLHKAWKVGVKLGIDKSVIMWSCLQGRQAALEFTQYGFSNHPVVHTVLNEHMPHWAIMSSGQVPQEGLTTPAGTKWGTEKMIPGISPIADSKQEIKTIDGHPSLRACRANGLFRERVEATLEKGTKSVGMVSETRHMPKASAKKFIKWMVTMVNKEEKNVPPARRFPENGASYPNLPGIFKPDFTKWFHLHGKLSPNAREIKQSGLRACAKADDCSWWNYYQETARIGLKPIFDGPVPSNADRPPPYLDPSIKNLVKEKLSMICMMIMFYVPNGETDVCIINSPKSGLNNALYAPRFTLPTVDSMLQWQFLNFLLHPDLRKCCKVDLYWLLASASDEPGVTGVWMPNAMGLKSSPYNSIQGSFQAKQIVLSCPWDPKNPYTLDQVHLNLPGIGSYDPTEPWVSKVQVDKLHTAEMTQYVDDVQIMAPTEDLACKCSSKMAKGLCLLGLQVAAHQQRSSSRKPGAWAHATVSTNNGQVCKGVTKDRWTKLQDQI